MKTKALLTLTALTMVAAPAAATAFAYPHFTEAQNSVQRDDMQAQSFDVYGAEVRLDHVNNKAYVDVYHSHSDNLNNYGYTISHNGKTITSEEVTVQPGISTIEFGSVDDVVFNNGQAEFVFEITEEEHQQGFTFVVDEPVVAEYDATIQKVNGNLRFTIS